MATDTKISIQIFPYACPGFARLFRHFVFKNAAFYRVFRDFRGLSRGSRSAAPNASETTRFHAFFAIFGASRNRRFSYRFFEKNAKTTRFHAFLRPRVRASGLAFSSFSRARSSKTCRKPRVFRVSVLADATLCFSRSFSLPFLCFFQNVAKTTRFHAFF